MRFSAAAEARLILHLEESLEPFFVRHDRMVAEGSGTGNWRAYTGARAVAGGR